MNTNCPYNCGIPLLSHGALVRVGVNQHAHRGCYVCGENEARHFEDLPCVRCCEDLSRCQCCPNCAAREHSGYKDCETCEDYQWKHNGPDPAFAAKHLDEIVGQAVDEGVLQ